MLLATEPGSSKASTGAHARGPLTLPVKGDARSSESKGVYVYHSAATKQYMGVIPAPQAAAPHGAACNKEADSDMPHVQYVYFTNAGRHGPGTACCLLQGLSYHWEGRGWGPARRQLQRRAWP